ncbi:MAG: hypothetical protein HY225_01325 [Candidatus Vogelbacteria bacterium]|nr:hypothetical protein [Candidatus Vogelbacteria bacterium]
MSGLESIGENKESVASNERVVSPQIAEMMKKAEERYGEAVYLRGMREHLDRVDKEIKQARINSDIDKSFEVEELRREGFSREDARRINKINRANEAYGRAIERRREKELSELTIREARDKRNELLEDRGLFHLSKEDFQKYFASTEFDVRAKMNQQNVGDCYLIAAIHALSCSPHYEMIVRSSVKRLQDGSWGVRIPLLSQRGKFIRITPNEIEPQKNPRFLEPGFLNKSSDKREVLYPVKGREGLQVLESAFMKSKFGVVDRLTVERGSASDALKVFGGDNFHWLDIVSTKIDTKIGTVEELTLASLDNDKAKVLDSVLENFDPEVLIATAATMNGPKPSLWGRVFGYPKSFQISAFNRRFFYGHAYSVSRVDSVSRMVTVMDPGDTSKPIELTFSQFKDVFSQVQAVRIDSARLLGNMEKVIEKIA